MAVNLRGPFICTQSVLPDMVDAAWPARREGASALHREVEDAHSSYHSRSVSPPVGRLLGHAVAVLLGGCLAAHPSDGRKVSVIGTASGTERIGALFGGLMSQLDELNAEYTTEELAVIADYQRRAAEIQAAESQILHDDTRPGRM